MIHRQEPRTALKAAGTSIAAGVLGLAGLALAGVLAYWMTFGFGTPAPSGNEYDPANFVVEAKPPAPPVDPADAALDWYNAVDTDANGDACLIKGNISYNTGEAIYHVPGQAYYAATIIDESFGERWFCTEDEAIAAGWRKSEV